ncbi:MAG: hypothetical protein IPI23_06380 [Bacteroidetes bacterium]|nr:hypothetical protein [Bacteroidota bacterium]
MKFKLFLGTPMVFVAALLLLAFPSFSQHYYFPLNRDVNNRFDPYLYQPGNGFHTSIKPYISNEVHKLVSADTTFGFGMKETKFSKTLVGRKLFNEHLFSISQDDFMLYGDLNIEFRGGRSMEDVEDKNTFINSRGITVGGTFGNNFSFTSSFVESQATFPSYIDSVVEATFVVPGGSRIKNFNDKYDYGTASGTISYSLKKHFSFQLGHDKNFIGDGYRSMLLSDNSYNYPFLKINASFWKIKYMVLYALFQDGPYLTFNDEESYRRKYGTFHYLDIDIGKKFTFGILEAIIWKHDPSRAFDINYMNPVIFLRPVEFSIGSPDNALLGFNFKYRINKSNHLYGQLMLDEFKLKEVRANDGWWGNKQAFQAGFKTFNIFGINNLHAHTEFNYARPYTYQHRTSKTAYAHYNQALAHPLGANFWESVSFINYSWKRWHGELKVSLAEVGFDLVDSTGTLANYGQNVLLSYDTRPDEYGNQTLQGMATTIMNAGGRVWYLLNPKSNMVVEAGVDIRRTENVVNTTETMYFYFGIKTSLTNRYTDF